MFSLILAALLSMPSLAPAQHSPVEHSATHKHPEAKTETVGYFPQWGVYNRRYVPIDLIKSGAIKSLTQIDYAQANIKDNACIVADPLADLNIVFKAEDSIDGVPDQPDALLRGNFRQLRLLRERYPNVRVIVSIEGDKSLFEEAAKPENRVAFVHSCVARFLEGHIAPGIELPQLFDGIDVDWEYPRAEQADNFYGLLAEFRRQMDAVRWKSASTRAGTAQRGFTLSIATGASHKNIDPIDWARVAKSVDQVGVMTYDFQGPWSHDTGFIAPLRADDPKEETVTSVIDAYLAAGVPPHQLLMGLPFYAYQWHNVKDNPTHGLYSKGDALHGNLNQSTAVSLLAGSPKAKLYRDPASQAPWIYDGDNFLTFEDPVSLKAKAVFARQRDLGGVMIWELSGDTNDAQLLRSVTTEEQHTKPQSPQGRGSQLSGLQ